MPEIKLSVFITKEATEVDNNFHLRPWLDGMSLAQFALKHLLAISCATHYHYVLLQIWHIHINIKQSTGLSQTNWQIISHLWNGLLWIKTKLDWEDSTDKITERQKCSRIPISALINKIKLDHCEKRGHAMWSWQN